MEYDALVATFVIADNLCISIENDILVTTFVICW